MPCVETGKFLVFHQEAVSQPSLLTKDDGFGQFSNFGIDLGMRDVAFTHTAVGPMVVGTGGNSLILENGSHIVHSVSEVIVCVLGWSPSAWAVMVILPV